MRHEVAVSAEHGKQHGIMHTQQLAQKGLACAVASSLCCVAAFLHKCLCKKVVGKQFIHLLVVLHDAAGMVHLLGHVHYNHAAT